MRTRVEWFLANNEILRAKTALEVMAIEHLSGKLVMPPQSASIEAEYNEQYILWAGPMIITKFLRDSEPLLADFSDLPISDTTAQRESSHMSAQDTDIPYPFRFQIEQWRKKMTGNCYAGCFPVQDFVIAAQAIAKHRNYVRWIKEVGKE